MSSTSQLDGLSKVVESIKQTQEKMEKSMEKIVELFKIVEDKMNKKFEELHTHLNNIIQEIKGKQNTYSGVQKTTGYMLSMLFKL